MDCPECKTNNPSGQKFCGSCGHKLESECIQCGTLNPPHYKFCGDCGATLAMDGAIVLARSGLITQIDQKAADLLGLEPGEMQGKPFSLFVARVDMVIFFSHWNEVLSSQKKQSFELGLKHKKDKTIYVAVECNVDKRSAGSSQHYQIILNEVTDKHLVSAQLQHQQNLLGLIYTTTDNINSVTGEHFDLSLEDTLKKICLVTQADRCFIYTINPKSRCLEPAYQWCQPSSTPHDIDRQSTRVPLRKIKRAMVRFLKEQAYVVNEVAALSPAERNELLAWHQADLGAVMCHLIRSGKRPIGIIGVAKDRAKGEWAPDCVALVKFFGQIISEKLPMTALVYEENEGQAPPPAKPQPPESATEGSPPANVIDISKQRPKPQPPKAKTKDNAAELRPLEQPRNLPDMSRPMRLEKISGSQQSDQHAVYPRDDGLVLLTCPRCGFQETISIGWFEKLGNAISVTCPCEKHFWAVLEQRHAFRKPVKLDGFFTLNSDLEKHDAPDSIWGPMVVTDLSKAGLRFSSDRYDLVHPGDLLMVRFNLDNSNQALIHKPARVVSTTGTQVGCRFEGDDSYDITLGFYFI